MRPETKRLLASQRSSVIILGCFIVGTLSILLLPPVAAFVLGGILGGVAIFALIMGWRDHLTYYYGPRGKGEEKEKK
jgi:hypothetical protein